MTVTAALSSEGDPFAITPSDSVNFTTNARRIYVGGMGNIVVVGPGGAVVTFIAVPTGTTLVVNAKRVNSTSTTATNLVGIP